MSLFNSRKKKDLSIQPPATNRVEVELHKAATVQAVKKAKVTNQHLNELLVDNGFTLKIYLAAGGKTNKKVAHSGH